MTRVRQIEELNSKRRLVRLDDDYAFPLYYNELRQYAIVEGEEISPSNFDTLMKEVLPKRVKLRAMNLLKLKPYTVKGLRDKLRDNSYPEDMIDTAIDYVSSFRYLDDHQYAIDYIETYRNRKNTVRLKQELSIKGVDKDIIEEAFAEVFGEETEDFELSQIRDILRKKHFNGDTMTYEERMKIMASVCRKGYSPEKVKRVMSES